MSPTRKQIETEICKQMAKADEQAKHWNSEAARLRYALWGFNHPDSLERNDYEDWLKYNMPKEQQS